MSSKSAEQSAASAIGTAQLVSLGKEHAEAMLHLQKDLLAELEKASQSWVTRIKSEIELWSDLSKKVSGSHTISEGLDAYRDCVAKRMKMAVDDGQRLFNEGQNIIAAITKSMNGQSIPQGFST